MADRISVITTRSGDGGMTSLGDEARAHIRQVAAQGPRRAQRDAIDYAADKHEDARLVQLRHDGRRRTDAGDHHFHLVSDGALHVHLQVVRAHDQVGAERRILVRERARDLLQLGVQPRVTFIQAGVDGWKRADDTGAASGNDQLWP